MPGLCVFRAVGPGDILRINSQGICHLEAEWNLLECFSILPDK